MHLLGFATISGQRGSGVKMDITSKRAREHVLLLTIAVLYITILFSGCTSKGDATIIVNYNGDWDGAIGEEGSTRSVSGHGNEEFTFSDVEIVAATIQKADDSSNVLTVIIKNGEGKIVKQSSTSAEYGIVSIAADVSGTADDSAVAGVACCLLLVGVIGVFIFWKQSNYSKPPQQKSQSPPRGTLRGKNQQFQKPPPQAQESWFPQPPPQKMLPTWQDQNEVLAPLKEESEELLIPLEEIVRKRCPNCKGIIEIISPERPLVVICPTCYKKFRLGSSVKSTV